MLLDDRFFQCSCAVFVDFTGPRAPQILAEYDFAPGTMSRVSSVNELQDVFDNLIRDGVRPTPLLGFALACAALVIYTHRGNVRRMRAGTEPRARRLWLLGRPRD